jgi:hypothetical protein
MNKVSTPVMLIIWGRTRLKLLELYAKVLKRHPLFICQILSFKILKRWRVLFGYWSRSIICIREYGYDTYTLAILEYYSFIGSTLYTNVIMYCKMLLVCQYQCILWYWLTAVTISNTYFYSDDVFNLFIGQLITVEQWVFCLCMMSPMSHLLTVSSFSTFWF